MDDKPAPVARCQQEARVRPVREHRDDRRRAVEIDHQPHRLAEPAPTRQPVGGEGVAAPGRGGDDDAVGRLRVKRERRAVALLEAQRVARG